MKRKKLKKFYSRIISFLFKQFINNIKNIPIENAFITSLSSINAYRTKWSLSTCTHIRVIFAFRFKTGYPQLMPAFSSRIIRLIILLNGSSGEIGVRRSVIFQDRGKELAAYISRHCLAARERRRFRSVLVLSPLTATNGNISIEN